MLWFLLDLLALLPMLIVIALLGFVANLLGVAFIGLVIWLVERIDDAVRSLRHG